MNEHIIWTNKDLDIDGRRENYPEYPDYSDEELQKIMEETNNKYLEDERMNLNVKLPQEILVVADLGLWNGHHTGYKEIKSGNIRDCLYGGHDYTTWFVDQRGDLRCEDIHHDGTNYYLYRVYKENISERQKDNLKSKILNGSATRSDITRITKKIGNIIGDIYGWKL